MTVCAAVCQLSFMSLKTFARDMLSAIKRTLFYDNRGISLILN